MCSKNNVSSARKWKTKQVLKFPSWNNIEKITSKILFSQEKKFLRLLPKYHRAIVLPKQHIVQFGRPFATNITTISPATPPTPQSPEPLSREPPFCYVFCRREDQQCEVCGRCEELPVGCNPTQNERIPQFAQPLCVPLNCWFQKAILSYFIFSGMFTKTG